MTNKTTIDPEEIAKFAQLADSWWNTNGPLKTLHDINPARLEFISKQLTLANKKILDVGCGGGILSEAMAGMDAEVTGIDAEIASIKAATLHANLGGCSIDYVCTPIESYEASGFDAITCMEMLEHVKEPQVVINHCARLLKPGGFLFLSTINRTLKAYMSAVIAAEYVLRLLPKQTHDYNKFITPAELAMMARKAGLEIVSLQGMAYNPFTRTANLQDSVSVNFLMSCTKP
ncbi:MAG: bifunctional 2-polyprenyl-6-hydroxyphenol methylase/3-demethylubiquinol 3-O-methyltransferase UbiG [Legionella sp.]|nr:bifunctional 2-polyprenyl-6-hydroxyphenol methylase/3-demethylubiquinol 3-O-methyltransferase UbiG [Legionella sp.]